MDRTSNLAIYLNDHLAGAVAGSRLAKRARDANSEEPLAGFLSRLSATIDEDRDTLERLMRELDVPRSPVKGPAAAALELLGRLKPNGRLRGYSPLSRMLELEGLYTGISGKLELWRALDRVLGDRLPGFDFAALAERADEQRQGVEEHRATAAEQALEVPRG